MRRKKVLALSALFFSILTVKVVASPEPATMVWQSGGQESIWEATRAHLRPAKRAACLKFCATSLVGFLFFFLLVKLQVNLRLKSELKVFLQAKCKKKKAAWEDTKNRAGILCESQQCPAEGEVGSARQE